MGSAVFGQQVQFRGSVPTGVASPTLLSLAMQSVALGLLFFPVTMAAYIGMPAEKANSMPASMVTTLLARGTGLPGGAVEAYYSVDPSFQNEVKD